MDKIKVLILSRNQGHHFSHLYNEPDFEVKETDIWNTDIIEQNNPDILLTPSCDWYESYNCIEFAKKKGIPTLYCPDGIIEWRHTWENPRYGYGNRVPYQQPVITDKIACMGLNSFLLLENFGNAGKCELVGSPRLEHLVTQYPKIPTHENKANTLLIATANTAGFTDNQIKLAKDAIIDIKKYLDLNTHVKPIWRISSKISYDLGIIDEFPELRQKSIEHSLEVCDAVLTTQSTLILESWLYKKPLATINYWNSPEYINPAWTINNKQQIATIIDELLMPEKNKMHFQETQLLLNLNMKGGIQNHIDLIKKMIELNRVNKKEFNSRILPLNIVLNISKFDRAELYPKHEVFKMTDFDLFQKNIFLEEENINLKKKLETQGIAYWLNKLFLKLYKLWK